MQITFNPTVKYTPAFSAKSKEIRKADDIQRKTRTEFPFFSPHYAKVYFPTTVSNRIGKKISYDKTKKLDCMRKERYEFETSLPEEVRKVIKDTVREKIANCGEAALITMSTLLANGYTDTHRCAVILSNEVVDKKTGDLYFLENYDLDHACVVSTMAKAGEKKPYIVLDSWHGFADSLSSSRARYLQLTKKEELDEYKDATIAAFEEKKKKKFDFEKYEVRQKINFEILDSTTEQDDKSIKNIFKKQYKQLIFDESQKD